MCPVKEPDRIPGAANTTHPKVLYKGIRDVQGQTPKHRLSLMRNEPLSDQQELLTKPE